MCTYRYRTYNTREYLRYMGRRSVVVDHLFSVRLQGSGLAYAAGAPARGATGVGPLLRRDIIYIFNYIIELAQLNCIWT